MLAQGIRKDVERTDNDHQILLQYDPDIFEQYGQPLDQMHPHHCGPEKAEARYFFYTGNTNWGIQNLEYDPYKQVYFMAVYTGVKPQFPNYHLYAADATQARRMPWYLSTALMMQARMSINISLFSGCSPAQRWQVFRYWPGA